MYKQFLYKLAAATLLFMGLTANAATFSEGFEANQTGSYTAGSVVGDACTWTTSDAGVFTDSSTSTTAYSGSRSLRLGKTATSYALMASDKSGGAGVLSFYARTWSTADGNATVQVQYSTNSGSSWTTAGTITLSSITHQKYSYTLNISGNVRIKFNQTSGKRCVFDDVTITDYSGSTSTTASISSPVNGSTVDFGSCTSGTTSQKTIVVKGTGLTSATTVAVSGTGFSCGSTSLSASKVNSDAGAQLQVNFKSTAGGSYTGTLTLTNGSTIIKVNLKASIAGTTTTSPAFSSPTSGSTTDFGTCEANTTVTKSINVKGSNLTSAATVTVSGTGFSVNSTSLSASTVNSTNGGTLQVNFKGTSGGTYTGTLKITSGSASTTVNLKATVAGTSTSTSGITSPVNGSTVDFGSCTSGTTSQQTIVVKGTGLTSATSVAVSGTGFTAGSTSLSASKVNSSTGAQLQVNFKSTASGSYTGTLTLTNGSTTIKVNLKASIASSSSSGSDSGSTTTASYTSPAAGSTVDFGTVTLSKTQTSTVVVKGTGLTAATTVTVTGTGFSTGSTSLSASKVNSSTGAQLQINFKSATAGTFTGTLKLVSGSLSRTVYLTAKASSSSSSSSGSSSGSDSGSTSGGSTSGGSSSTGGVSATDIPSGYYSTCEGKYGSALLSALCSKISSHTAVSYSGLWTAFKDTDTKSNGKIWDMYSTKEFTYSTNQCGSYSKIGDCYNREHSFPKSWFKDATPMYTDLFHIYPTDGFVNNQRANYPFGECANGTYVASNGTVKALGKLGKSTYSGYTGTVWEPDDEYKGDFARSYFYMVTAYNTKVSGWSSDMLNGTSYPAFTTWAMNLLLNWNALDPVSQKEVNRQTKVYAKQKNRNPFIDHPELADYIWGSKKNTAWNESSAAAAATISYPADGSTLSFGTTATGSTNAKTVAVKSTGLSGNITATVSGTGFTSAEIVDTPASVSLTPVLGTKTTKATTTAANDEIYVRILFEPTAAANYNGTLTLTSGDVVSNVNLTSEALDGLPAAPAEKVTSSSFTARWVEVGDTFDDGTYRLDVADANGPVSGFPVYVNADDLTYEVTGLEANTEYTYSLTSQTVQSNVVKVTTLPLEPNIYFVFNPTEMAINGLQNTASEAVEILLEGENLTEDITFTVTAPFEVSLDGNAWATSVVAPQTAESVYVRLGATENGLYNTSLRASSGTFYSDVVSLQGIVMGETFLETFEKYITGLNSYSDFTYEGDATQWNVHDGLFMSSDPVYAGTYSLRMGKESDSYVEMVPMKYDGMKVISFYARKWSATETDVVVAIQYLTDEDEGWKTIKTVTLSGIDYELFAAQQEVTGAVRIRIAQVSGGRWLIDNIGITSATSDAASIESAADFTVTPTKGGIEIATSEEMLVSVYGIDGIVYLSSEIVNGTKAVTLPAAGIYVVAVGDKVQRVIVR